jgi:co-chaperonin GroES (HSP10)
MEAKTAGGIYLPESSVKELNEARVLAVGPGGLDKDGKRVQCSVAPGDKVLIPQVSWTGFVYSCGVGGWNGKRDLGLGLWLIGGFC